MMLFVQIVDLSFIPSTHKGDLEEGEVTTPRYYNLNTWSGSDSKFFQVLKKLIDFLFPWERIPSSCFFETLKDLFTSV